MVSWGPHSKVAKLRLITCILAGQPTIVTITSGAKPQCKPLALGTFEPTLQGSYVIYTIHGFTAGAFTWPIIYCNMYSVFGKNLKLTLVASTYIPCIKSCVYRYYIILYVYILDYSCTVIEMHTYIHIRILIM